MFEGAPPGLLSHLAPAVLVQRLQQLEKESGDHACSCLLFLHRSFEGRSLLVPDFFKRVSFGIGEEVDAVRRHLLYLP